VVPLPRPSVDATQSFSVQGLNGIVFASFPAPALKIAELLVHECSHQFYHFGQLDTLFTNGMDAQLYWSPYVQKERPIDRIFIAFHAFANIVLFYRACLSAGMSEGHEHVEQTIKSNLGHLGPMSGYLERSPGLSPTGRGLFEPLREKLFR
jgi:HEXXH motif-containing protein